MPPALAYSLNGLSALYAKYGVELMEVRKLAKKFCSTPKPAGFPHTHKCLSTLEEMEMLYMGIRERPPVTMLEVASASGYSTLWIVSAMAKNGGGRLYSFDLFKTPFPDVLDAGLEEAHWEFTQGDVHETLKYVVEGGGLVFDRILIDAEHTRAFGYFYLNEIIRPQLKALQEASNNQGGKLVVDITVHNVFHFEGGEEVTGEGDVVLNWAGYQLPLQEILCLPSFNPKHNPMRHAAVRAMQKAVLGEEGEGQKIGQFPHGDFSLRCVFRVEPMEEFVVEGASPNPVEEAVSV